VLNVAFGISLQNRNASLTDFWLLQALRNLVWWTWQLENPILIQKQQVKVWNN